MCHDSFSYLLLLLHARGMTHSFVCQSSFIRVTRLIGCTGKSISQIAPSYDSFSRHTCDMPFMSHTRNAISKSTNSYVWLDSIFSCHTCDMALMGHTREAMSKSTNLYLWIHSLDIHGRRTCRFKSLRFQCILAQSSISCESEANKLPQNIGGCHFVTLELFREWYRWCFSKQNLFFFEKWLIHTTLWAFRRCCSWLDSFVCVKWRIHTCDVTHLYVWHGSFICVIWQDMLFGTLLIYVCDMVCLFVWCDSFGIHSISLISMCDMTNSYVWHDWLICMTWLIIRGHDSSLCVI